MKNKVDRLQAIKEIIISYKISSQEDLLKQLTERGFNLTQATLSRDLKQLQIAKVAGKDGGYLYVMPETAGIGRLANAKINSTMQARYPVFFPSNSPDNWRLLKHVRVMPAE